MKKFLNSIFFLVLFSFAFLPLTTSGVEFKNPLPWGTFEELLSAILKFLTTFALLVFPIIVIVAGYLFMTAGGDPQKIENAKTMLWYAFIGLIIILASRAILEAIKSVMGVK